MGCPITPTALSPANGTSMIPKIGLPSKQREIKQPKFGMPVAKARVPSIGSTTQIKSLPKRSFSNSSPNIPWFGKVLFI